MQRSAPVFFASLYAALILGCDTKPPVEPALIADEALLAKGGRSGGSGSDFATRTALPGLQKSTFGEAYAVTQAGSLIAGYSWDQAGLMHPVTWTLLNGSWTITALPFAATATSAKATAVNDQGDVAGHDFPASTPHPVLWPSAGGFSVLGCGTFGEVFGMSSGGQVLAGVDRHVWPHVAVLWRPGVCREVLPPIIPDSFARATAVNGDGTIVGGTSMVLGQTPPISVPVRWRRVSGAWQVEQLDSRPGIAQASNSVGDLAGEVQVPCASGTPDSQCFKGMIWFAAGGSRELPTLGGETTAPRGINAVGEVVGLSTLGNGNGFPFIWSETMGMRQLPLSDGGWAFGVSGVRPDGTRLVVGFGGRPRAAQVWVVQNP